jgi:hypothetical protein
LDKDGDIRLNPLFGYETATVAAKMALVRLDYANSEEEWKSRTIHRLQLALTPVQCRALVRTLLEVAEAVESQDNEHDRFSTRLEQGTKGR